MAKKNSKASELPGEAHEREQSPSIRDGEWLIHIKEGIHGQNCNARPPSVSIFSVPKLLVDLNRDAYIPQVVSMGPCYHRIRHLSDMDNHKLRAVQRMMKRLRGGHDINSAVREIEKMDGKIRDTYEKVIDCNSETLAWMMVLDAAFLLEIFQTLTGATATKDYADPAGMYFEPIFDENRIKSVGFAVLSDILKLENQIPLFVLLKLLEVETGSEQEAYTRLYHLLVKSASTFFPFKCFQRDHWSRSELDSLFISRGHFLGFLHGLILSNFTGAPLKNSSESPSPYKSRNLWNHVLPPISRLCKAGISVRPYKGEGGKAVRFEKESSTLYLPIIMITENTETILRNLIALEAFLPTELQMISCYVGLMDSLIYAEGDVTLLRRQGILHIYVGNDAQVSQLWESLCKGMNISSLQPLRTLKKDIMECYRSKYRARIIEFMLAYCTRPWRTTISVLAATLIFVFTLTQTMSSMYGFYKANP